MTAADATARVPASHSAVPRRRTQFFGRQQDVAGILERLRNAPVVTLVGVGGVGKTRLAYEVASRVEQTADVRVHVVELAATLEGDRVVQVVADALALPVTVEGSPVDAIAAHLAGSGSTLLLLDNCEQVVDSVASLADELLDRCPSLTVLGTSRVPLGVDGEVAWPVEPLPIEGAGADVSPAVQLLIDRAEAAHPRALEGAAREQLVALARRLDGLPLAIELAASRLGTMDLSELMRQLDDRLLQLESSRRDVTDRHRSLASVVDWSYRLLDDADRKLAACLSVFPASFTREAATIVLGLDDPAPLERLAEVSILSVTERGDGSRLLMLELIREFLGQRLEELPDADDTRHAFARWCVDFVTSLQPELRGPHEASARRRLRAELANVGAALEWAADGGHLDVLVPLVRGLHDEVLAGGGREVHAWLERAVAAAWEHRPAADVLATGATGAMVRGDLVRYRQILEQWDRLGGDGEIVVIDRRLEWASLLVFEGRVDDAVHVVGSLGSDLPSDPWRASHVLMRRAQPYAYAGNSDAALELTTRSIALAEQSASPTALGWARYIHGEALMGVDAKLAISSYEDALDLARSVDNAFLAGLLSVALASALGRHGAPEPALRQFRATIERWRDIGGWSFLSTTLRNFGELMVRLDRFEETVLVRCALEHLQSSSGTGGIDAERDRHLRRLLTERLGSTRFDELRRDSALLGYDDLAAMALEIIDVELHARERVGGFQAIVFTDIEQSTDFTARVGDARSRRTMREYERRTHEALDRAGGQLVKGTGDGVLATFPSVVGALHFAAEIARDIRAAVDAEELPLRLKIGIHAGEVIVENNDVYGTIVNLAARVAGRAAGGEILVTDTVRQIAAGHEFEFTPLGEHEFKGIPEPVRVYRLET